MSDCYYDDLAKMEPKFREIALELWDITGRPQYDNTYNMALGRLMDMSNDWSEFKVNYLKLFTSLNTPDDFMTNSPLHTNWMCYIYGMKRLLRDFEQKHGKV